MDIPITPEPNDTPESIELKIIARLKTSADVHVLSETVTRALGIDDDSDIEVKAFAEKTAKKYGFRFEIGDRTVIFHKLR